MRGGYRGSRRWRPVPGYLPPLVNVVVFETEDGLVLVDAGMAAAGPVIRELIASVTDAPIHTIIYTHCHGTTRTAHGR